MEFSVYNYILIYEHIYKLFKINYSKFNIIILCIEYSPHLFLL